MPQQQRASRSDERGIGLIEIVIAMFLLAVIALSILPVIINSLKLSSANVSLTTATQLVNEQMDLARGLAPTCAALRAFSAETIGLNTTDPKGRVLEIHRQTPATCPVSYPSAFLFKAWVTKQGSTTPLASSETRIHIDSEN